jgi:hypothetical protein
MMETILTMMGAINIAKLKLDGHVKEVLLHLPIHALKFVEMAMTTTLIHVMMEI